MLLGSTFASVSKTRALIAPPLCCSSFWGVDEKLLWNYFLGLSWGSSDHCGIMTWGVVIIESYISGLLRKMHTFDFFQVMLIALPLQVFPRIG